MPFSPEEIRSRDFLVALRGYDKDEVATFLREVADQCADLMAEVALAREERTASLPAGDPFAGLGDHMASVMRAAAEAATKVEAEAVREAASIRATALDEASHAAAEARLELEVASELRAEAEQEAAKLRASAREEVQRIRSEARQVLDQAKEARVAAEREVVELRESVTAREQELRAQAEQRVEQFIVTAKQDIEDALTQIVQRWEGRQRVGPYPGRDESAAAG